MKIPGGPVTNPETMTAVDYHRATSYRRGRMTPHRLDWAHQPLTAKNYVPLHRVPLDRSAALPEIDYFGMVKRSATHGHRRSRPLDIRTLSAVLQLTHTVTARSRTDPPFYYRNVASAGALYPFEIYLAVHRAEGLDPGVYHYQPFNFSLTRLRRGRWPEIPPAGSGVAATFYISAIFFRSAWKYRSRAYRYVLLDAGHLLENLRLALVALDRSFSMVLNFDDRQVETLLGLDPQRESGLVCVHLHTDDDGEQKVVDTRVLKPLDDRILQASLVADQEVIYPDILKVHRAGHASTDGTVDANPQLEVLGHPPPTWIDLDPPDHSGSMNYVRMLWQRRSRRNFVSAPASREALMTFLDLMTGNMGTASTMPSACRTALMTGLLLGAGSPLAPGFYLLDPQAHRLGRVSEGRLTGAMAAACLDQMWLKHATVHLLFMTDLAALERVWGARGYRYAMIEAGRLGQQAYLAAAAAGWGACGIGAIYDREAADLLDLAVNGTLLYLVGVGSVKTR